MFFPYIFSRRFALKALTPKAHQKYVIPLCFVGYVFALKVLSPEAHEKYVLPLHAILSFTPFALLSSLPRLPPKPKDPLKCEQHTRFPKMFLITEMFH